MQAPFWRDEPLTPQESELLTAIFAAHHQSAQRQNISTSTLQQVAAGSMSYTNAIAAALLSIGNGIHAPLEFTIQLLTEYDPAREADAILQSGCKLPGWGNSFVKGEPDPLWKEVDKILWREFNPLWNTIYAITDVAHEHGKKIYPNPSTYTAAAAILLRIPPKLAPYLFVAGRLSAWSKLTIPYLK